jgi:heptosyltransferase-3
LLRDRFPHSYLEILGAKQVAALAENRFYADAVRSIESGSLARTFARNAEIPGELAAYFAGFDLILSYLYDPDGIFETNVRVCTTATFIAGPSKPDESDHAVRQLARPLQTLGLFLTDPAARLFPTEADRLAVQDFHAGASRTIALHYGSGSESKNWPIENWIEVGEALLAKGHHLLVVAGEADRERTQKLREVWPAASVEFAENLPLTHLAALLEPLVFIGHDSGISHIAAASGASCLLLFGPTNPAIWAPQNENVAVLCAPRGDLRLLSVETVLSRISEIVIPRLAAPAEGPLNCNPG